MQQGITDLQENPEGKSGKNWKEMKTKQPSACLHVDTSGSGYRCLCIYMLCTSAEEQLSVFICFSKF